MLQPFDQLNPSRFKNPPYKHQARCLAEHGHKRAFFLSAEMGTGKTFIIINNLADLWAAEEVDAVIVFAPNGVHTNWTLIELPKHMPDWVTWRAAAWGPSMGKAATKKFDEIYGSKESANKRELRILCMNWEGLNHKRSFDVLMRFALGASKLAVIGDEPSGYIKNPSSARFKALLKFKYMTKYRRMMDGTPVTQGPFDVFAPYNFLDKTILQTESYMAFKAEYAEMVPAEIVGFDDDGNRCMVPNPLIKSIMDRNGSKRVPQIIAKGAGGLPKYKNLDKLTALVAPHTFRVLKADCLDLPEKVYKTAFFELTPQQRAVYKKAEDELRLVYLNEETPFAKLTAVTKLAQITRGFYIHPEAPEPLQIEGDNPALELLKERVLAIVSQGDKVIVWARFHAELALIAKMLMDEGIMFSEYHGGVKMRDRETSKTAFQDGESSVFLAQQQAGGTGLTLHAAAYTIYFSNTFSLRDRLQSEDRNHRIGQTRSVLYLDLVARGTIDERIVRALKAKKDVADLINGDGKELFGADAPVQF